MSIDLHRFWLVVPCVTWVSVITAIPVDAGVTKLNPELVTGGSVQRFFKFTSDGSRVLYRAD